MAVTMIDDVRFHRTTDTAINSSPPLGCFPGNPRSALTSPCVSRTQRGWHSALRIKTMQRTFRGRLERIAEWVLFATRLGALKSKRRTRNEQKAEKQI